MHLKSILIVFLIILGYHNAASQKAMRMPSDLQDFEKRVRPTDYFKNRATLREPWIAYSDRTKDFGTKYYVTDENVESVFLYTASGHNPRNLRL